MGITKEGGTGKAAEIYRTTALARNRRWGRKTKVRAIKSPLPTSSYTYMRLTLCSHKTQPVPVGFCVGLKKIHPQSCLPLSKLCLRKRRVARRVLGTDKKLMLDCRHTCIIPAPAEGKLSSCKRK